MTAVDTLLVDQPTQGPAEPARDRWGRPLIRFPGSTKPVPLTRVTTIAETLSDRYALEQWACRMTALGIAKRQDLYAAAVSLTADDSKDLNRIVDEAKKAAGAEAGATTGTALHRMTERVDRGETFEIPPPWDADVTAYQRALDVHGIEIDPNHLERFVVNQAHGAAGTADRLCWWRDRVPNALVVADLKTGKHLNFGAIAIQLALYANAETHYDPASETHTPAPAVDRTIGLVFHLPAGTATCDIYEVDLVEGLRWAKVAIEVREWRKEQPARWLQPPSFAAAAPTGDAARVAWCRARLELWRDEHPAALARLASIWPPEIPTFTTSHVHTVPEIDRIENLIREVEKAETIPFPDRPPPPSLERIVADLAALPPDLFDLVEQNAVMGGIPHLRSNTVTPEHLDTLRTLIDEHNAETQRRVDVVVTALDEACGMDPDMVDTLLATVCDTTAAETTIGGLTAVQVDHVVALAAEVTHGRIQFIANPSGAGWMLEVHSDALGSLLGLDGVSKTVVRDVAKAHAERLDLPKPRSADAVAGLPLLFALTAGELDPT